MRLQKSSVSNNDEKRFRHLPRCFPIAALDPVIVSPLQPHHVDVKYISHFAAVNEWDVNHANFDKHLLLLLKFFLENLSSGENLEDRTKGKKSKICYFFGILWWGSRKIGKFVRQQLGIVKLCLIDVKIWLLQKKLKWKDPCFEALVANLQGHISDLWDFNPNSELLSINFYFRNSWKSYPISNWK